MSITISRVARHLVSLAAIAALIAAMGGSWTISPPASAAPVTAPARSSAGAPASKPGATAPGDADDDRRASKPARKEVVGKLNINTATEEQLMLLPTVGPAKAERVVVWRKKNGGFKRVADLRRVKGFGYKTFKRLEPFLDIKGDTTLAPKP